MDQDHTGPELATVDRYRVLARHHPGLAAVLLVCLLGLVGTPPTAIFVGKLAVFSANRDGDLAWPGSSWSPW